MDNTAYIKKQTLYLAVVAALIIGFLGGVVFSVYRGPASLSPPQETAVQQETSEAIASLKKATRDQPNDGQAWVKLGHAFFDTGQTKEAIVTYNKALELLPGDLDVMTDLGVMYHQDNRHQEAIDIFDQVLKIDPQHEQARFNKGVVLLAGLNNRKRAIAEWKILVRYHPTAVAPTGPLVTDLIKDMEQEQPSEK